MTRQRTFKGRVRERMGKTGESYTAARRQLLHTAGRPPEPEAPAAPEPPAGPAGMRGRVSDEAVAEATGRSWDDWFPLLDAWGAVERKHGEIARWLREEHGVAPWWSQSVAVAYEQARGMRKPGQAPDGTYAASASRTVGVPVERLYAAFADEAERARWLPDGPLRPGAVQPGRSLRAVWEQDGSRLVAGFERKGEDRSLVALQHERLPDAEAAERMKAFWRERLSALKALLESPAPPR